QVQLTGVPSPATGPIGVTEDPVTVSHTIGPDGMWNTGDDVIVSRRMSRVPVGTSQVGGWIKIELQRADRTWEDVTQQILDYGISGKNQSVAGCQDPSPNAIIRVQ